MFFNSVDQLRNADGLGEKRMSLDAKAGFCLSFRDERREKDDRRSVQFSVGLDLRCYFASVSFWHHDIKQDKIWPKIPGALMSLGSVVFFEHQIVAGPFEKNFHQVSGVPVVIDNQDAPLFVDSEGPQGSTWPGEINVGSPGKEVCF